MKSKTFIILLMVCTVFAGFAYVMLNSSTENRNKPGGKLFESLSVNDIAAISISGGENSVKLRKIDIWQVENRYNFPADFSMITDFVRKLKDLKIDRTFKITEETMSRLVLRSPDDKEKPENQRGTRVVLEDKDKKVLADIILGATRESPAGGGGHYLRFTQQDTIYLVDKNFKFLDKEPHKWLDKELVKASQDEIESVTCMNPATNVVRYTFRRPEKGKEPEMVNKPANKKLDQSKVSSLFGAISSFQSEDLADPAKNIMDTGIDTALCFEFRLFDGRVYKIYPGKAVAESPEKYYFKTDAAYIAPPEKPEEASKDSKNSKEKPEDKKKKEAEKKQKQAELSEQAKALSKKLSAWTFIVPKWRYDNFVSDASEFFEKEKPAETK